MFNVCNGVSCAHRLTALQDSYLFIYFKNLNIDFASLKCKNTILAN